MKIGMSVVPLMVMAIIVGCLPEYLSHQKDGDRCFEDSLFAEAVFEYTCALQYRESAELLERRAVAWEALGYFEEALTDYGRALERGPGTVEAYAGRARTRLTLMGAKAAEADSMSGTKRFSREAEVAQLRSLVLTDLGKAIRLSPRSAYPYRARAHALYLLKDYASAEEDLSRALAYGGSDLWTFALRARVRSERGDFSGSREDYSTALLFSPGDPELLYGRGLCNLRMGRGEDAIDDFGLVIRRDSSFVAAYVQRALVRVGQGDTSAACLDACMAARRGSEEGRVLAHRLACDCR